MRRNFKKIWKSIEWHREAKKRVIATRAKTHSVSEKRKEQRKTLVICQSSLPRYIYFCYTFETQTTNKAKSDCVRVYTHICMYTTYSRNIDGAIQSERLINSKFGASTWKLVGPRQVNGLCAAASAMINTRTSALAGVQSVAVGKRRRGQYRNNINTSKSVINSPRERRNGLPPHSSTHSPRPSPFSPQPSPFVRPLVWWMSQLDVAWVIRRFCSCATDVVQRAHVSENSQTRKNAVYVALVSDLIEARVAPCWGSGSRVSYI